MSKRTGILVGAALVGATLSLSGCGESPVEAAQSSPEAMFAQILDKLDMIEQRIDSLEAAVEGTEGHETVVAKLDSIGSELDGIAGGGGGGGGGVLLTGLHAEQLDSLIQLASFLAEDAVSASAELCGGLALGGGIGWESIGEAKGEGVGSLGAWAGSGAYAGAKVEAKAELSFALKLEGEGGVSICKPIFAGTPPVRPAPTGPLRNAALDPVRTSLDNLSNQLSLTPATLAQSIDGIGTAVASPTSINLQTFGDYIPLPSGLSSIASDPVGTVVGGVQGLATTAQNAICSANLGANFTTIVTAGCDVIANGGMANFTAFADMVNTYPTIQTAVTNLQTTVSGIASTYPAVQTAATAICTRVNTIGNRSLNIPSRSIDLGALGTYTTFPGFNWDVFPNYTSVTCP